MNNFDMANLENCRKIMNNKKENGYFERDVYTMIQVNEPCKVDITRESRKKCASALVK